MSEHVLAKISRAGESFWVKDIVELEPGIFKGIIDNHVVNQRPMTAGDVIAFVEAEVREVKSYPAAMLDTSSSTVRH